MTDLKSKYSVVLRANLPAPEVELLAHYARRITSEAGQELLFFDCASIDTSHGYYLIVEAFLPGAEVTDSLMIPHSYVFLISGGDYDDGRLRVGFTSSYTLGCTSAPGCSTY
jgi:hypothetical protein